MNTGRPIATISFARRGDAGRRIAGVAAAARIVRELAQAGFGEARLALPAGDRLNDQARTDLARLAGAMTVVSVSADTAAKGLELSGELLFPAAALAAMVRGETVGNAIRLDAPGAGAEILRQTVKASDGLVSVWLNRPISRRISATLLWVPGIRPIHATIGTALLAAAMFAFLVGGDATGLIAGGLLFHAASVFDGVDGEMARATFRSSPAGATIDNAVDIATNVLFLLGLTWNLDQAGHASALPLAAIGLGLFAFGLAIVAWRSGGPPQLDLVKQVHGERYRSPLLQTLIRFLVIVSSRDFFALLFAVLILIGWPVAVLYIFAAAAIVWFPFVVGSIRMPAAPAIPARRP
ncbi:MAG: CDP-alcohol phosphatidyltransferase family protein [Sphingosinicella sp.]